MLHERTRLKGGETRLCRSDASGLQAGSRPALNRTRKRSFPMFMLPHRHLPSEPLASVSHEYMGPILVDDSPEQIASAR